MRNTPSISEQAWGSTHACLLSDGLNNNLCILPKYGGLLLFWKHRDIDLIETFDSENALLKQLEETYPNCKLSPFACRINNGEYKWNNQSFSIKPLKPDGHALHGWMYKTEFFIKEKLQTSEFASLVLHAAYNRQYSYYPFSFYISIKYTLYQTGKIEITTYYENTGKSTMPLVDGWHPYFITPEGTDQSYLQADISEFIEANKLIPTGRNKEYLNFKDGQIIGDTHWDTCFFWKLNGKARLKTSMGTIIIENIQGYDFLQIYTPPHRKSIALEPLTGAPDAFNNKIGLTKLAPKEKIYFTLSLNFISN
ncbi:MAG: aldose 1-epimerase [Flavobacteriales bacterium]|nr:aldose 1-epimerase [Flavobacteriales bacterium]